MASYNNYKMIGELSRMKIKKVLLILPVCLILLAGTVWGLRKYNDFKYGSEGLSTSGYMEDVTNKDLYPTRLDGVDIEYVDSNTLQGFHLLPEKKLYKGVVVCYGGSEGGPYFDAAARLALAGYETLAVFMFGMENQQKTLVRIPLEQFEDVLDYIHDHIEENEPVSVVGASKGAEYALNLAVKYDEISNLILIAPSAYTFAGLDFQQYGSSWTWQGEELPYIDIQKSSFLAFVKNLVIPGIIKSPIMYKETYDSALEQDSTSDEKRIPVEKIKANMMLIAGEDDQMWNSPDMAKLIKNRNEDAIVHSYENAGHIFWGNGVLNSPEMRIRTGGRTEANEKGVHGKHESN